MVDLIAHG